MLWEKIVEALNGMGIMDSESIMDSEKDEMFETLSKVEFEYNSENKAQHTSDTKANRLISHVQDQVAKEQWLNAASASNDLVRHCLSLFSEKIKSV